MVLLIKTFGPFILSYGFIVRPLDHSFYWTTLFFIFVTYPKLILYNTPNLIKRRKERLSFINLSLKAIRGLLSLLSFGVAFSALV